MNQQEWKEAFAKCATVTEAIGLFTTAYPKEVVPTEAALLLCERLGQLKKEYADRVVEELITELEKPQWHYPEADLVEPVIFVSKLRQAKNLIDEGPKQ